MKYFVANLSKPVEFRTCAKATFFNDNHITRIMNEYEVFLITEGELFLQENGKEFSLKKGDVYIAPINISFGGSRESSCSFRWQHFLCDNAKIVDEDYPKNNGEIIYIPQKFHLEDYTDILLRISSLEQISLLETTPSTSLMRNYVFSSILADLSYTAFSQKEVKKQDSNNRFNSILEWIRTTPYLSKCKNLRFLSKICGYSEKYLIKLFKQNIGITPMEYINERKIFIAQSMLAEPNNTTNSIVSFLGFDYSYFLKVFKKKTGMTPTEYRKKVCPNWSKLK